MNIFNSLGSNYNFSSAMRTLVSVGGKAKREELLSYLEKRYGGKAILVYKGREALLLALNALPEKGSVAMNGFTCLAVYEAIVASGHTVQYLDIAEDSLDFSLETLHTAADSNPNIKAVIVQNTLGIPCDIRPIAALCKERGIVLIEDLAHSIGAHYTSGEEAGTVGDFVVLSFSQDKVVDAVSGGALIVRNPAYVVPEPIKRVALWQQIKDRLYPDLTWRVRLAYSSLGIGKPYHALIRALRLLSSPFGNESAEARALPGWYCSNILRQYRALEKTAAHRRSIAQVYVQHLDRDLTIAFDIQNGANLRFPIFLQGRDRLVEHLKDAGVYVSDIWYDAPIAPKKYMHRTKYAGECPQAENISRKILNLPTHINVSAAQAKHIAEMVNEWQKADTEATFALTATPDKEMWEGFMQKMRPHSFLHSWTWGAYHEATTSVFRVGVRRGETIVAVALFIKVVARRGSFLLCPHGPVISQTEDGEQLLRILSRECTRIARAESCDFIRFCPLADNSDTNISRYRDLGFRDAPIHMHPELSWMLDITRSEDDLLREMRKTTRYLIKKMEKDGVEITQSNDPNDIEKFWTVYQATVERQHFTPFGKTDLKKEFELFAANNEATFFFGSYKGELIAAAIIIFYNGQAFYHHSGSTSLTTGGKEASYLLQWRVIQEAKRRGCTLYNFWGISPTDQPQHPWAGLSLFKKGFGGFAEEYLHAQDKPLTAKYAVNYIIETMRRINRGL